jgi:hypothetical protein
VFRALGRLALAVAAFAVAFAATPEPAIAGNVGAQFRYWAFKDHNDNRDVLVYYAPGPFHVQLETWDYVHGRDQFRPEVGIHLRDKRRSSYTVQWRHEDADERLTFGTEQVLSDHFVGKAYVNPLVNADSTVVAYSAGLDYYWHSYSFAGADVIRDPRGDDLWVVPVRVRFANEHNDWLQLLVAPASKRSLGWAADVKLRWLRLGVERNSRFDFSTRDNVIYTAGVEFALPKPEH